ncbi:MAG: polyprenyl synthetase family protein [Chloroflexi bacterium]|nr:polyprenyl synthetase family protein [Chloroflexota bacterium]
MKKPVVFDKYHACIEAELRASLDASSLPLYDMLRYHLGWLDVHGRPETRHRGKLLRSTLCLSANKACGGDPGDAVPAAAAVELVHNFSLIHDDVQDGSEYRRHQPAVWKVWGVAQAITAGDTMYALAHLEIPRLSCRGVAGSRVLASAEALGQACRSLCEGQYLDVLYERRSRVTMAEYMRMVSGKTGALMGAAARIGALVATEDQTLVECLASFGEHLGIAYQVLDDMIGIWEEVGRTGKSRYEDILKRKKTLPVIYGLTQAAAPASTELAAVYSKDEMSLEDAERVAELLERAGARDHASRVVEQHRKLAVQELAAAPGPAGVDELLEIVDFVLDSNLAAGSRQ